MNSVLASVHSKVLSEWASDVQSIIVHARVDWALKVVSNNLKWISIQYLCLITLYWAFSVLKKLVWILNNQRNAINLVSLLPYKMASNCSHVILEFILPCTLCNLSHLLIGKECNFRKMIFFLQCACCAFLLC